MPNNALSEALREAYASAPSDVVILHTLELRHPSFMDDDGQSMAIRVVRDNQNLKTCIACLSQAGKSKIIIVMKEILE